MTKTQKNVILLIRIAMGWLLFYAGITKILNPEWSTAGYLQNAKTFPGFYDWLASPGILPITNFLNEWGLTLIGAALILGAFTRLAAYLGAVMMLLYYFPVLNFPYAGQHSYIVDEHLIYFLILILLGLLQAGMYKGMDKYLYINPKLKKLIHIK